MDEARYRFFVVGMSLAFCYSLHYALKEYKEDQQCYAACIVLLTFILGVPILRAIYHCCLGKIFDVAAAKAGELSQRITYRLSEVGRKVSDRKVTEKKLSV